MSPDEPGDTASVDVTGCSNLPVQIRLLANREVLYRGDRRPVQEPHSNPTSGRLLKYEIFLPVMVQVADRCNLPVRTGVGDAEVRRTRDCRTVHQPDADCSVRMLPDQVGASVTVDIADPSDLPIQISDSIDAQVATAGDRVVQECPVGHPSFGVVSPYQIWIPIAVQIA